MVDIIHRVGISAPLAEVYKAIATVDGITKWWTRSTSGESRPGGAIEFRFESVDGAVIGAMKADVIAWIENSRVQWRFTAGPAEWIGTDVVFNLKTEGEYTIVLFSHQNWREAVEFMAHCSMKWATFLLSLKDAVREWTRQAVTA